jgi:hypothetical protein
MLGKAWWRCFMIARLEMGGLRVQCAVLWMCNLDVVLKLLMYDKSLHSSKVLELRDLI